MWLRGQWVGDRWVLPPSRVTDTVRAPWGEVDEWRIEYFLNSGRGRVQVVRMEINDQLIDPLGHKTVPAALAAGDYANGMTGSYRHFSQLGFVYFSRDRQYVRGPHMTRFISAFPP